MVAVSRQDTGKANVVEECTDGCVAGVVAAACAWGDTVPIQEFVRHPQYTATKISPDGRFLALAMQQDDVMSLAVLRMKDMQVIRITRLTGGESVGSFYWVGDNRIMYTSAKNYGSYAVPFGTGEWYAMDSDGGRPRTLVSYNTSATDGNSKVMHFNESLSMLDPLPDDESKALMQINDSSTGGRNAVVAIDTVTGRRQVLAGRHATSAKWCSMHRTSRGMRTAPRPRTPSSATTSIPSCTGSTATKWTRIDKSNKDAPAMRVVGTAADGRIYAIASDGETPSAFGILDPATDAFHPLYRDPETAIHDFLCAADEKTIVGLVTMAGAPHVELVDTQNPDAAVYASLSNAFPGELVDITSATRDGKKMVVTIHSDTDPGQLYLYDRDTGTVRFLMKSRPALDPALMARVAAVLVQGARRQDDVRLHDGAARPGRRTADDHPSAWRADRHPRRLGIRSGEPVARPAAAIWSCRSTFAVPAATARRSRTRVTGNGAERCRTTSPTPRIGSSTRVTPIRSACASIGASYGGYASLMGAAKEPTLYQCAVGYVGIYDLNMMFHKGDIIRTRLRTSLSKAHARRRHS